MGLPGVGNLNGPCGIHLPLSGASQLPYSEKYVEKLMNYNFENVLHIYIYIYIHMYIYIYTYMYPPPPSLPI